MKTPRELLLEHHQPIEPRLDAIRHRVVHPRRPVAAAFGRLTRLLESIGAGRGQILALASAWVAIAALNHHSGPDGTPSPSGSDRASSPQSLLVRMQENQRRLRDLLRPDPGTAEPALEPIPAALCPSQATRGLPV
ncbi:MAG: hypothetical protein KF791_18305 [Verrucomicrobiae bacterium]|nr:hypothetical protein [Verrucomicrobiae bacterium]